MGAGKWNVDNITKSKEAVKTGLAFALVFGIAMQLGWMNPYWAGWAVAVIALPTAGESIRKGAWRIAGTIPGCLAALVIHALAPQERWTFMCLTCAWAFGTSYFMLSRTRNSYFWVMACYVCLIILLSDLESPENMFEHAVFRTVETVMGVVVYTLISVFLWPRTNLGAIKQSSTDLAAAMEELARAGRDRMLHPQAKEANLAVLQANLDQQLARLDQSLQAEGSESYEVGAVRHLWERFQSLASAFSKTTARWQSGLAELEGVDLRLALPELPAFFAQLDARLTALTRVLAGQSPGDPPRAIRLEVAPAALQVLTNFDRAAVEVTRTELDQLEALAAGLIACARELSGQAATPHEAQPSVPSSRRAGTTRLPVPDWEHVRGAAFVAATTGVGFLIWILFDPPGHSGWFQVSGTIALLVALSPQIRASRLIGLVTVTSAICLAIYVLVMPRLSSFLGLGSLLFACMFLNCYFLVGLSRFFASMAMLNMLQIQNEQVYSFHMMANMFLFLVMAFTLLYVMSYQLGSPRPEKALLRLLGRLFRSAAFLLSRPGPPPGRASWRSAFHERQLRSLPAQLAAWGKAIDPQLFPANSPEQIHSLVSSVQALVHRFDQFMDAGPARGADLVAQELRHDLHQWQAALETLFRRWARNPEAEPVGALRQRLEAGLARLEERVAGVVNRGGVQFGRTEAERFLRLLGGYRGVSEAAVVYAGAAQPIDWSHWREERFS